MDRALFTGSPAYVTHDAVTAQFEEEQWSLDNEIKTIAVRTNLQGQIGEREDYTVSMIRGTPLALTTTLAAVMAKFWAKSLPSIGSLLFPATDLPLIVQTKTHAAAPYTGQSLTFSAGALSQPPELVFCPTKPFFGQTEWTALRKNNTAASAVNAHVVVAASAYSEPTLDALNINDTTYTMSWGAVAGLTAIECDDDGVRAKLSYDWSEKKTWRDGLINYRLTGVTLEISLTPVNVDADVFYDSFLLADGASAGRGKLMSSRGQALTITGANVGDPVLTVANAVPVKAPLNFGGNSRVGSVTLRAQRSASGGFYTLGVVPA